MGESGGIRRGIRLVTEASRLGRDMAWVCPCYMEGALANDSIANLKTAASAVLGTTQQVAARGFWRKFSRTRTLGRNAGVWGMNPVAAWDLWQEGSLDLETAAAGGLA